jgi:methylated-DNA-[protein]-cysteine S-methyltransferase
MPAKVPDALATVRQQVLRGELCESMTFSQRVWALTARVPRGQVTTYGLIARQLGSRSGRAVGQALHRNPWAPAVPCHRVVASDGKLTGFAGGLDKKRQLLEREGVAVSGDKADLARVFRF